MHTRFMARLTTFVACGLIAASFPGGAAEVARTPEQDLRTVQTLETRLADAFVKKDLAFIASVTATDLVLVGGDGKTMDRNGYLAEVKKNRTYTAYVNKNMKARVFGDSAVVSGAEQVAGVFGGWEGSIMFYTTRVWAYRANTWQVVLWQATNLPADAKPHPLERLFHGG